MKKYTDIREEEQARFDQLITDCRVFFAFSNAQFEEGKTPLNDGDKYVSIGGGGYMPKSMMQQYVDGANQIEAWSKSEIETRNLQEDEILYELNNHECFYTGSIEAVLFLPYTREEILKVYREHHKKWCEANDY